MGSEVTKPKEESPTAKVFPPPLGRTTGNEARSESPTAKAFPSPSAGRRDK